ncbi:tetratricopeptide repeat protein [Micromonospora sp. NPDC000316]|uniref:tetratricopeptide repeat protein n=1 Tax=Micromonospora sp. NPDC000316 TaxID=3364216 RepID=UPI003692A33A
MTTPPNGAGGSPSVRVDSSSAVQIGPHNVQTNVRMDAARLPPPQRVGDRPGEGAVVHNLPAESQVFVGRDLEQLDALLAGDASGVAVGQAAVHGLGGIGKSELVLHYARHSLGRYRLVWWMTADSPDAIAVGLGGLTRRLHPAATLADAHEWAVGWLQTNPGWLLVLDNVEDVEHILGLLGLIRGRGDVLVTTRRDVGGAWWRRSGLAPLRLGVLARAESVDLLYQLTGLNDPEGAGRLAGALGDLPLALEQAAAYISHHPDVDFDGYRQRLTDRFARTAAHIGVSGRSERTIAGVWQITMNTLAAQMPLAARVLDVLAWLAPDGLPADVLYPLADDHDDVREAIALLASYNIINRTDGTIGMHRLVQAVTRANQDANDSDSLVGKAIRLLTAAIPDDPWKNPAGWPRWTTLLPHIDALTGAVPAEARTPEQLHLANQAATFRQGQGQHATAIILFEQVLADRRRVLGDDHPGTLASVNNLAGAYRAVGRVAEAIILIERVLADRRRVLGDDHPDTLVSGSNLAGAYRAVGRIAEAITLYEQVLVDRRRVLGDDHPNTLASVNNLAYAYRAVGRVAEAFTLYERVLADRRRVLGDDHPDTLTSVNNLAYAYQAVGRIAEAITLYEQVLVDRRRVLGDDHPKTLISGSNLAYAYRAVGRAAEAFTLDERVLADRRRVLGDDHPNTLASVNNLAHAYRAVGRAAEAIILFEQVLVDRRRVLGDDHPDTLISGSNLASAYQAVGRAAEAITLHERVLADRRRVLGDDHPNTLTSVNNLAHAYQAVGRIAEAITLHEQVLADRRRVLGDDHPDTLISGSNLAGAYQAVGRVAEAITLHERVLADRRRVLGDDHPDSLASVHHLAYAYESVGRVAEAITLYERVLADRRRVLGDAHQLTRTIAAKLQQAIGTMRSSKKASKPPPAGAVGGA